MSDEKDWPHLAGHGLWYVSRDGRTLTRLDFDIDPSFGVPGTGTPDVLVHGAEREVLKALLRHALTMLAQADSRREFHTPLSLPVEESP